MKLLKDVEKIFKKKYLPFELPTGATSVYKYFELYPEEKVKYSHTKNDSYFIEKYRKNITIGHYGFATAFIPENWANIIDDILELCLTNDPNFQINQIKTKFGGVRFYVSSKVIDDLYEIEKFMSEKLYSPYLMY